MKVHTTNYINTFIEVAEDCPATTGETPPVKTGAPSLANLQYDLLSAHPYQFTSDEVLVQTFAERNQLQPGELEAARKELFCKGQPCMRSSPLAKRYGWGFHHDAEGKIAIFGVDTEDYQKLTDNPQLKKVKAMRSKKG
jgi:hypothetical protein